MGTESGTAVRKQRESMARGDKSTYNQQQQQAFGQSQGIAGQDFQNQQNLYSSLAPAYENELNNPGYTDAEKQAMRQATAGSLAGAFGAARQRLMNQAARTGNSAGVNATEEELGREQAQQNAQAMGGLEGAFGNARMQNQNQALAGLGNLYGSTTSGLDSALNNDANLVNTQGRVATTPGFWSQIFRRSVNPFGL